MIRVEDDGTTRTVADDADTGKAVRAPMALQHPDRSFSLWTRAALRPRVRLYDGQTVEAAPPVVLSEVGISWRPTSIPPPDANLTNAQNSLTTFLSQRFGRTVVLATEQGAVGPVYTVRAIIASGLR